jgi:HSP20 family protein
MVTRAPRREGDRPGHRTGRATIASVAFARWDPVRDLLAIQLKMERLPAPAAQGWVPAADLCETAEAYIVTAELPGVPRAQIRVDVHDGQLVLHGRRDARVACEQYHQVERGHGEFSRTFRLPVDVDASGIAAELKDGVLTIVVPKAAGPGPRRIDVG